MKANSSLLWCLAAVVLSVGCKTDKPADGPAERAGKKVDNAAEDVKQTAKDAKDDVKRETDK